MGNCGIYTITNIINGKIYVGYATHIQMRWNDHISRLNSNTHGNIHLQRSFNRDGETNFLFEILVECKAEFLASEEHYWCNILNTHNRKFGYNIQPTSPEGIITHSAETRAKMSKSQTGKKRTKEDLEKRRLTKLKNPVVYKKEYLDWCKENKRNKEGEAIVLLHLDGSFYGEWRSIIEACEVTGLKRGSLAIISLKNNKRVEGFYKIGNYIPVRKSNYDSYKIYKRIKN